jgi:phosphatidylglycerophosphatase A
MRNKFLIGAATLWGIGHVPFMPGTVGAFLGTVFSYFLFKVCSDYAVSLACVGLVMFAICACSAAERAAGHRDPSHVILDEFVAMPVFFLFLQPRCVPVFLLGFLIFRVFDILKPFGIRFFERLRGGWGIVLDDVVAPATPMSFCVRWCTCIGV